MKQSSNHIAIEGVIGHDAMLKLCDAFGGETLYIPNMAYMQMLKRNDEIMFLRRQGVTVEKIAEAMNVSPRTVQLVIRKGAGA